VADLKERTLHYPSLARRLLEGYLQHGKTGTPTGPTPYGELSERELEVMLLLVHGLTNQEISEKLVVSSGTVQTHRSHILQKLSLETTVDLVRHAIRHGLIEAWRGAPCANQLNLERAAGG